MRTVTYTSERYRPELVVKRYVRASAHGGYRWSETSAAHRDLRQGTVTAGELPKAIRAEADRLAAQVFGWVEWPGF